MPMLRASGGTIVPGVDSTRSASAIWPLRTGSKPATQRRSVLLPQPDGPSRQPISPGASVNDRSRSTGTCAVGMRDVADGKGYGHGGCV